MYVYYNYYYLFICIAYNYSQGLLIDAYVYACCMNMYMHSVNDAVGFAVLI